MGDPIDQLIVPTLRPGEVVGVRLVQGIVSGKRHSQGLLIPDRRMAIDLGKRDGSCAVRQGLP